jgi:Ras-related protein Rab-21
MSSTHKVVLLGEGETRCGASAGLHTQTLHPGRVGKTSLLLRYVTNVFSETQPATIQASYLTKRVAVDAGALNLAIWDTAGQERFHALGPIYYRDADGEADLYAAPRHQR